MVAVARSKNKILRRDLRNGLLFISPWIVGFLLLTAYPMISAIYYSFTSYNILRPPEFIGLANFKEMLFEDSLFWTSLKNTGFFVLFGSVGGVVFALFLAALLNAKIPLRSFYRTVFFLPVMVPVVCTAIVWAWLLNTRLGLVNNLLGLVGLEGLPWLTSMKWVKPSLLIMHLWGQGRAIVIFLAALQTVPRYMYESAEIEGAGSLQKFWHITVPIISPVILINLVMSLIRTSQFFAQPFIMTNGGPGTSSLVYAMYLHRNAFRYMRMGYAASMTWFLFFLVIAVTIVVFRTSGRWVHRAT